MSNHPIFDYNKTAFGGTESMVKGFLEKVLPEMKNIQKYKCVVLPGHLPELHDWGIDGKETILWLHNTLEQFDIKVKDLLSNKLIFKSIRYIITVSEYQKDVVAKELNFPLEKIIVIPNAIDVITPTLNKFDKIDRVKLIHASSSDRGLKVLMDSIPFIEEDFELNIFNNFYPDLPHSFNLDGVNDSRVNFYGKTPKKTVYKFMADSHIHAYPSIYPETSCLTQMETLSAGCYGVVTSLGALLETSLGYGTIIPIQELTPEKYAEEITKTIKTIKENGYDYTNQIIDIEKEFSWNKAKKNWLKFDSIL